MPPARSAQAAGAVATVARKSGVPVAARHSRGAPSQTLGLEHHEIRPSTAAVIAMQPNHAGGRGPAASGREHPPTGVRYRASHIE